MLSAFWEGISGKLVDRFVAASGPALVFWFGGLLAWLYHQGEINSLREPTEWLGNQPAPTQIAVLFAVLLWIIVSGEVVAEITTPALRLLEGYWPSPLTPVRKWSIRRVEKRVAVLDEEFQSIASTVNDGTATIQQRDAYVGADRKLRRFPANGSYMPTNIGNILRAAESRPVDKYGLDAVATWTHLWLLLPDATKTELLAARRSLNAAVGSCLWGGLFVGFTPLAWWAAVVGVGVIGVSLRVTIPMRAMVFADLVEAAFDLHRRTLYAQLHWPLPTNPREERLVGQSVTTYLWRGLDSDRPIFSGSGNAATPAKEAKELIIPGNSGGDE